MHVVYIPPSCVEMDEKEKKIQIKTHLNNRKKGHTQLFVYTICGASALWPQFQSIVLNAQMNTRMWLVLFAYHNMHVNKCIYRMHLKHKLKQEMRKKRERSTKKKLKKVKYVNASQKPNSYS